MDTLREHNPRLLIGAGTVAVLVVSLLAWLAFKDHLAPMSQADLKAAHVRKDAKEDR
jgi:hypothetical protein